MIHDTVQSQVMPEVSTIAAEIKETKGISRSFLICEFLVVIIVFSNLATAAEEINLRPSSSFRWLSSKFTFFQRNRNNKDTNMGNVTRAMSYSVSKNEKNAIPVLELSGNQLKWFRLDDGVMGGQSETVLTAKDDKVLHFHGTINTNGGGFTSIRAKIPEGLLTKETTGLNIRYRGDGKTYKVLLSDGNRGGPFARTPTWQADLSTKNRDGAESGTWDEVTIPFTNLQPAFGGGPKSQPTEEEKKQYSFNPLEMKELGFMLSLRLSDGSPNPPETFGTGIFPFSLKVQSLKPVQGSASD